MEDHLQHTRLKEEQEHLQQEMLQFLGYYRDQLQHLSQLECDIVEDRPKAYLEAFDGSKGRYAVWETCTVEVANSLHQIFVAKIQREEEIWFNGTSTQKGHIVPEVW
jgi:hypothetical protein